jgi:hypothetical protein
MVITDLDAPHRFYSSLLVLLTRQEAKEIVDSLQGLLGDPGFHHEHVGQEGGASVLTFSIFEDQQAGSYHASLQPIIEALLKQKGP